MEGRAGQPKMMSVGLHCRLSRPARVAVIAEFLDYAKSYGREVWITTREAIAKHWHQNHLPRGCGSPILSAAAAQGGVSSATSSGWGGDSLLKGWTRSGASSDDDDNDDYGDKAPVASTPSKFSFLGNLKAPRDSEEYKDSLKKKESSEDLEEEPDVI